MFQPLTRQPTLDSVRSYWSDRNSLAIGATINLHAVAKPVMRVLYHRAVLDFIAKNRGRPLSREEMEIYSSYLAYSYVSSYTKAKILWELGARSCSTNDAQAVVNSLVLRLSDEFLSSPDAKVREAMCLILAVLADDETTLAAVLGVRPCMRLVALLRDENLWVTKSAVTALARLARSLEAAQAVMDANVLNNENLDVTKSAVLAIARLARSLEAAQAAIDANVLDYVPDLLRSPDTRVRGWTCGMLASLAAHNSIRGAIVGIKPCPQLISLLRDENLDATESAAKALTRVNRSLEAAQAAVDANVLDYVPDLLRSQKTEVREWACEMLVIPAWYKSIRDTMVDVKPCVQLVSSLVRDENLGSAVKALAQLVLSLEAAQTAVDANVLDALPDLLRYPTTEVRQCAEDWPDRTRSPNSGVCEWACEFLIALGRHECIRDTIVGVMCPQLGPLLRQGVLLLVGASRSRLESGRRSTLQGEVHR
ncbi:armadillo-type protein [Mycena latifolia]|nr:armadillo-type protein [Mycena latifolia]